MNEADVKSFCATLQATMLNVLRDQGAIFITDSRNLFRLETDIRISLRDLLKPTAEVLRGKLTTQEEAYQAAPKACTCPTADMLREGWKCNCGVKV